MSILENIRLRLATARKALQSASGSIVELRAVIAKLNAERRDIETSPLPIAEAAPLVDLTVTRMLSQLSPYFGIEYVVGAAAQGRTANVTPLTSDQQAQLLLIALRPILHDQFRIALDEHYRNLTPGLPQAERSARLAALDLELHQLQVEEEQMIQELSAAGIAIDRREDASPAAVLGLSG